jgi:hypothetical protein
MQKKIKLMSKPDPSPSPAVIIKALLQKDLDGKVSNAFEILTNRKVLELAYESIKSKPGNMVRGTTRETLDGISVD